MQVKVPDIGDFTDVEIIEVMVSEGDRVDVETPLITLETDKAAMDVPSPAAGKVVSLAVSTGDRVSEGSLILELEAAENGAQAASAKAAGEGKGDGEPVAQEPGGDADTGSSGESAGDVEQEVRVPDIGDFTDVEIIEVMVAAGDQVEAEQGLITLETDKAAMDVPSPAAGKVLEVAVKTGDKVSEGDLVLKLLGDAGPRGDEAGVKQEREAEPPRPDAARASATRQQTGAREHRPAGRLPPINEAGFATAHASPSVRRFARELGVDLGRVRGSGRKGRVTRSDVKSFVKDALSGGTAGSGLPELPVVDFSKFGPVERRRLSRIKKISGPRLQASWVNLPHVTQHDEADITALEKRRKAMKPEAESQGVKLTPLAFFMKACVLALAEFPDFNSSLDADGEHLVLKQYCHLGFAADTPNGLVVPVIRDADQKDVMRLAGELAELAGRARDGKLKAEEMQGACFTVSSLGGIGGTAFTPIINAPEVAILGISRARMQPVWDGDSFQPRLMLPLSLSYDHRVIDGAAAARFTSFLAEALSDPERLAS